MKQKLCALVTAACLLLGLLPTAAFAVDESPPVCPNHPTHEGCGYVAAVEGTPCKHERGQHDAACGWAEGTPEIPCGMGCAELDEAGAVLHREGCAYTPAVAGTPCAHLAEGRHDADCGYVAAVAGHDCDHACDLCATQDSGAGPDTLGHSGPKLDSGPPPEAALPTGRSTRGAVTEQFTLTPGQTYWFDLSGADIPGTVNTGYDGGGDPDYAYPGLPDSTLHYIPFTYAGTINAYVLKSRSVDDDAAKSDSQTAADNTAELDNAIGARYDHSLFIADYVVTQDVSWDDLNANNEQMIFGTSYASGGVGYTLRAPSAGSDYTGSNDSNRGTPSSNEWDAILDKANQGWKDNDTGYIKNWDNTSSWGQDTYASGASKRVFRGYFSARNFSWHSSDHRRSVLGFRPILELPAPDTLASDGLKTVLLDLSGGKAGTTATAQDGPVKIVVKSGGSFAAPSGEGLTRPADAAGDYFKWLGSDGNRYAPGDTIPTDVTALSAEWTAPNLTGITAPAAVTGVVNGTPLENIALPDKVAITTTGGDKQADVTWDRNTANPSYDPNTKTGQTFTISGSVTLPNDVTNTGGVSLTVQISVTVAAEVADVITGIRIASSPAKTAYAEGDALDLSGLSVTLTFSQSGEKTVALADFTANGVTTSPANGAALSTSDTSVIVSAGGKSANFSITVQAAQSHTHDYSGSSYYSRTLTDKASGVKVEGRSIHESARLTVEAGGLHKAGDAGCDLLRSAQAGGHLLGAWDVSLSRGFRGSLTVSLPVEGRNGQTLTVAHCVGGKLTLSNVKVSGGFAKVETDSLSPFAVLDGVYTLADLEALTAPGKENPNTGAGNPFTDVKETDWFFNAVMYAYYNGIMQGTGDTTFSPNDGTTRAQLATILWRMEGNPAPKGGNPFTDVQPDTWYSQAVAWCSQAELVGGYGGGLFGPGDPITREQLAALLYRYAQYKGWDVSVGGDTNILSYADAFDVSEWAIPAVQWACGAGIMGGTTDNRLAPQEGATRAQIAVMLMRLLEQYAPGFTLPATGGTVTPNPGTGVLNAPKTGSSAGADWLMLALPVSAAGAALSCKLRRKRREDGADELPDPTQA